VSQRTPIAIFVYRRAAHARHMFESLERCARLDECDITVFCDGAKNTEEEAAVGAMRALVREWQERRPLRIVESAENRGLARSVAAGVSQLCDESGRVIVLEDDLTLSSGFIDYMLQALDSYQDAPDVWQISGFVFPNRYRGNEDAFFLPLTCSWGWATWERAWRHFTWESSDAAEIKNPNVRRRFDLCDSYDWAQMLEDRLAGRNSSWAVLWYWTVFRRNGLALYPRVPMVDVGGFDGTGTHGGQTWCAPVRYGVEYLQLPAPLRLPAQMTVDQDALGGVADYLGEWTGRRTPTGKRVRYWMSYRLEGIGRLIKPLASIMNKAASLLREPWGIMRVIPASKKTGL